MKFCFLSGNRSTVTDVRNDDCQVAARQFQYVLGTMRSLGVEKQGIARLQRVGFTGVAGSVGWFTAMSLQEAALVKTLGQLEFVVSLLITYLYFGEKISAREYLGIGLVACSIVLLLWAT